VALRFDATADAEPGPRLVSFRVRYRGQGDQIRETDPIDTRIEVAPERDEFDVTAINATVGAGESALVGLRVENRLEEPVRNVRARLFVDDPLTADDSEAFVSRLDPGANATLQFRVSADGSAIPKEYPLLVDFAYEDGAGEQSLSDTYFVPATVTAAESGGGLPVGLPVLLFALVAVAVLVGVLYWRRRRKRRAT
jgi:hypothetical protein